MNGFNNCEPVHSQSTLAAFGFNTHLRCMLIPGGELAAILLLSTANLPRSGTTVAL